MWSNPARLNPAHPQMQNYTIQRTPNPTLISVAHWLEYQAAAMGDQMAACTATEKNHYQHAAAAWSAAAKQLRAVHAALTRTPYLAAALTTAKRQGHTTLPISIAHRYESIAKTGALADLERLYAVRITREHDLLVIADAKYERPNKTKTQEKEPDQERKQPQEENSTDHDDLDPSDYPLPTE